MGDKWTRSASCCHGSRGSWRAKKVSVSEGIVLAHRFTRFANPPGITQHSTKSISEVIFTRDGGPWNRLLLEVGHLGPQEIHRVRLSDTFELCQTLLIRPDPAWRVLKHFIISLFPQKIREKRGEQRRGTGLGDSGRMVIVRGSPMRAGLPGERKNPGIWTISAP